MPFELQDITLSDVTRLGVQLRRLGSGASSMEDASGAIVRSLYRELVLAPDARPACALVRVFVLLPYASLESGQQAFARTILPGIDDHPGTKCLTLLATAGDEPEWNARRDSRGHQALPLPGEESLTRSPMIRQLLRQLGVEAETLLSTDSAMMLDQSQHTFNVFHVAEASGSPYIPAQGEFVIPHAIRSVIGFGGLLLPGELFATILFTRAPVSRQAAELFTTLALNVKVALLPFAGDRIFS